MPNNNQKREKVNKDLDKPEIKKGRQNIKLKKKELEETKNEKETEQKKFMVALRHPVYAETRKKAIEKFNQIDFNSLDFFQIGQLSDKERDEHISYIDLVPTSLEQLNNNGEVIVEAKIDGITRQIKISRAQQQES